MKERKTVLLLIPNLTFGGAQRVFHDHSLLLSQHYEVIECVFNLETSQAFPSGNRLLSLDVKAGTNLFDKFYRFLQRIRRLRKLKKQHDVDICISHLEGADLVNILSRRRERIVSWIHGSKRFDQNISGLLGVIRHHLLIPMAYSSADQVVCVSDAIRHELIDHYGINPVRTITIHNFFDIEVIRRMANEPLLKKFLPAYGNAVVLIFSGRLSRQKNIGSLLTWYSTFKNKIRNRLLIVGDGELRAELLELCVSLKIKAYNPWSSHRLDDSYQVYFLGYQENPFNFVKHADVFLLPSLWEGFPMVLGEAMVCSTPIISADCPTGPREMLTDDVGIDQHLKYPHFGKYGVLMPLLDNLGFSPWTEGLSKILEDRTLIDYYRDDSLERIEFFSKEKNSQKVIDLVNSV